MTDAPKTSTSGISKRWRLGLFWGILLVGIAARLYEFPGVPAGLNQDELSAGYESWSLLLHGTDRWGAHLPAYFLSWGSGMNVLYSYLSIPFIALFGLTALAVRSVAMIFGILMLPLVYAAVKKWYGVKIALAVTALVAIIPWGFMTARWGLESNLLPFFLLLGVYTFSVAISPTSRVWQRVIALLPFAVALYAYGLGFPTVVVMLVLFGVRYRKQVLAHWRSWVAAAVLALVVALPFLLFVLKAYVVKAPLPFENILPFSIPTLTETRLAQVGSSSAVAFPFLSNMQLLGGGFADGSIWNTLQVSPPIPIMLIVLFLVDIVIVVIRAARTRKLPTVNVFELWLVACLPVFFLIALDLNQGNALYLPLLVIAVRGMQRIWLRLPKKNIRVLVAVIVGLLVVVPSGVGYIYYVDGQYTADAKLTLHPDLGEALHTAQQISAGKPLYITTGIPLAYVQTLWYLHIPATTFQAAHPSVNGGKDFENFHFDNITDPNMKDYYFFGLGMQHPVCANYTVVKQLSDYSIGYCS